LDDWPWAVFEACYFEPSLSAPAGAYLVQGVGPSLVILLHGFGSNSSRLNPLRNAWSTLLPRTCFEVPNAPFYTCAGSGYEWFSANSESSCADRIVAAREDFDLIIDDVIRTHHLTGRLDRVAFAGFSQGAIMALDAVVSGRWPIAAVVAFSGRLSSPLPLAPASMTQTMLIHGEADPVMPVIETIEAAKTLTRLGFKVNTHTLPDLGHAISSQGAKIAGSFLSKILD
jgi:phospholipase/carboxylesterase